MPNFVMYILPELKKNTKQKRYYEITAIKHRLGHQSQVSGWSCTGVCPVVPPPQEGVGQPSAWLQPVPQKAGLRGLKGPALGEASRVTDGGDERVLLPQLGACV